ncbi:MAG: universal stress protein [Actinomycetota bacterium]|nr:universal stress protein [Actinomycetota bacterium]
MARRIPRDESLARVYGTAELFSTAYGNVGSSIYYALGVVALYALGLTPITFIIAGLIFVCTAATYTEATVMYPEAGGSASFARHAYNEAMSFLAGWGQMLNYIITISISAFFVPHYLAVFWEPIGHGPGDVIAGMILIAGLAALNVKGSQESARLNLVLAVADLATQILLVVIGMVLVFNPDVLVSQVELGVAPTWGDFLLGIALGMVAYTGIETISNMAAEAKDAPRTIPRGVGLVVAAVIGLYAFLPIIALSAMPVQEVNGEFTTVLGTTYADDPVLGIVENLGLGAGPTEVLRVYVGVLAAVILLIATNAGLIGVSRLTYSMGQHRQLPERLRQVHPRFRTPYVAILFFSAVAMISLIPGETAFLATMYSFGAMLSFTIAHASVIRLRRKFPDFKREWKPPLNFRFRGVEIPTTAVVGGFGTAGAFLVVMILYPAALAAGGGWMLFGCLLYVLYRRYHGLPIGDTVKVKLPEPLGVEEIEYQSILVAIEGDTPFSEETVATALKLASRRRRGVHVVSVLTVPTNLPLTAPLESAEDAAQSKIEQAKLIAGGMRLSGHVHRVRPNQAGHSLAQEAREMHATALVIGLRYRDGHPLFSKTLQDLLAERPCRVIVVGEPGRARAAAGVSGGMPPVEMTT